MLKSSSSGVSVAANTPFGSAVFSLPLRPIFSRIPWPIFSYLLVFTIAYSILHSLSSPSQGGPQPWAIYLCDLTSFSTRPTVVSVLLTGAFLRWEEGLSTIYPVIMRCKSRSVTGFCLEANRTQHLSRHPVSSCRAQQFLVNLLAQGKATTAMRILFLELHIAWHEHSIEAIRRGALPRLALFF